MARRPVVVDPARKEALEQIGEQIVDALGIRFFEVDGTPMATVKYADGTFKKKVLMAGWEFNPAYSYVGTRGTLLIGMSPEDAQEYEFVEMDLKDLDNYFPMMGAALAAAVNLAPAENLCVVVEKLLEARLTSKAQEQKEAEIDYSSNPVFGMF